MKNPQLQNVRRQWFAMLNRCLNPTCETHESGVTVCVRWLNFSNFLDDMGLPPKGHKLHLTHKEIGYEAGNCKWLETPGLKNPSLLKSITDLKRTSNAKGEPMNWDDIARALGFNSASAVRYHMQKLLDKDPRCPMCLQKLSTKDVEH